MLILSLWSAIRYTESAIYVPVAVIQIVIPLAQKFSGSTTQAMFFMYNLCLTLKMRIYSLITYMYIQLRSTQNIKVSVFQRFSFIYLVGITMSIRHAMACFVALACCKAC